MIRHTIEPIRRRRPRRYRPSLRQLGRRPAELQQEFDELAVQRVQIYRQWVGR